MDIALEVLDGKEIKDGYKLSIQRAEFKQKGDYKERELKELDKVSKIKMKTKEINKLSWNDEDKGEGLQIIIIKNMFSPS